MPQTKRPYLPLIACAILIATFLRASAPETSNAQPAQPNSRTFPETGQTIAGDLLTYWNEHGALAQQGFPISPEMQETSEIDGKSYTVQYFERAKFEKHPEQADPDNRVLLELFGVLEYRDRYPQSTYPQGAPNQAADTTPGSVVFEQTGKRLGGTFLAYWKTHGDVRQQGYPISDVFEELAEDGKMYRVQYFERAKFELHTEFAGTPNEVLLSRIGAKFVEQRYVKQADGSLAPKSKVTPTATARPAGPAPTETVKPVEEGTVTLEVPYSAGTLTFRSKKDSPIFKDKSKEGIKTLFDAIYQLKGYTGRLDVEIISLPPGVLDKKQDQNYENGRKIFQEGAKTNNGFFTFYAVDMEEEVVGGVRKGKIYLSPADYIPNNMNLLNASPGTPDEARIAAGIEKSILLRYTHSNSPTELGQLIKDRLDLFTLWGGAADGNWDGGANIPLSYQPAP